MSVCVIFLMPKGAARLWQSWQMGMVIDCIPPLWVHHWHTHHLSEMTSTIGVTHGTCLSWLPALVGGQQQHPGCGHLQPAPPCLLGAIAGSKPIK